MRILMINQPLCNRGDESAHRALVRSVLRKSKDIKICVLFFCYDERQIEAFRVENSRVEYEKIKIAKPSRIFGRTYDWVKKKGFEDSKYRFLWRFDPTMRCIANYFSKADFILNAPGGICMGGFQNWSHLNQLRFAKYLGKKIVYYGRSFGPFPTETEQNKAFKKYSLEMLNYFSFLSIRDKKSAQLADSLKIPYESTLDTAFLEQPEVEIPVEIKNMVGDRPYMVFVPNLLIWHYAYKDKITKEEIIDFYSRMANIILRQNPDFNIVMLPQTFMFGNYLNDDVLLFRDISANMNDERIIVIPDTYGSDIQQTLVSKAKLLVGARYHSVVFAINNNVPFIALNYEHKIQGLLETLGKIDCMVDITTDVLTESGREKILEEVKLLLPVIKKDEEAQKKAKNIATQCFNKFTDRFIN